MAQAVTLEDTPLKERDGLRPGPSESDGVLGRGAPEEGSPFVDPSPAPRGSPVRTPGDQSPTMGWRRRAAPGCGHDPLRSPRHREPAVTSGGPSVERARAVQLFHDPPHAAAAAVVGRVLSPVQGRKRGPDNPTEARGRPPPCPRRTPWGAVGPRAHRATPARAESVPIRRAWSGLGDSRASAPLPSLAWVDPKKKKKKGRRRLLSLQIKHNAGKIYT